MAQHEYDKARTEFRNVLLIDSKDPDAIFLLGTTWEQLGKYEEAFANYRLADQVAPGRLDPKVALARLYLLSGEDTQARKTVDEILARQRDHAQARTLRALLLARAGDIEGATREAKFVLVNHTGDADAVSLLAGINAIQGKFGEAEQVLREAMKQNPRNVPLRLNLVSLLDRCNRLDEVETLLEEVVAMEPSNFDHKLRLAAYYARTGRVEAGERVLRGAIDSDANDERRYLALAQFLANHEKSHAGEIELKRALVVRPRSAKLRFALAELRESTGQPVAAERDYVEVIELTGTGSDWRRASNRLARLLLARDELAEAAKLISRVLKEDPGDADAMRTLGRLGRRQKEEKSVGDVGAVHPGRTGLAAHSTVSGGAQMSETSIKR